MINFFIELISPKIKLRPLLIEDYDHFLLLTSDPKMWYYFTSDLSTGSELEKWIEQAISERDLQIRIPFTIIEQKSGKIIGSTSMGNFSIKDKRVEVGWTWIAKEFQGKGFNVEAKKSIIEYCFNTCEFERVESKTDVLNSKARRSLKQSGFIEEGVLRSHTLMTNNRRRDTLYCSMLRREWNKKVKPT